MLHGKGAGAVTLSLAWGEKVMGKEHPWLPLVVMELTPRHAHARQMFENLRAVTNETRDLSVSHSNARARLVC